MAPEQPARTELPLQYYLENEYLSLIEIFHWVANLAGSVYTDTTAVVLAINFENPLLILFPIGLFVLSSITVIVGEVVTYRKLKR